MTNSLRTLIFFSKYLLTLLTIRLIRALVKILQLTRLKALDPDIPGMSRLGSWRINEAEAARIADAVVFMRWQAGLHYGKDFISKAGSGRHSFNEIVEHAINHLLLLYAGIPDDRSNRAHEHVGAVLWAMQIICLYLVYFQSTIPVIRAAEGGK
ncbi:MAG: hypothetical protein KatS3mg054_0146 [Chloroflexus sp.]|nr:MAG: hypothetical protein KatS3mg054_0146 [Chloroflexus sp.]